VTVSQLTCTGYLLLVACLGHYGCAVVLPSSPTSHTARAESRCAPPSASARISDAPPSTTESLSDPTDIELPFSRHTVELAKTMDVHPLLQKMAVFQKGEHISTLELLQLRQELTDRLLLTLFEVSSTVAEITCERDRADQIADRMDEVDAARVKRLTLISIVVGGVASIVSGGIGLAGGATTASNAADVAGGVFTSVFGGTALFMHSEHDFRHQRNLLKDVWEDPKEATVFSPSIWRFLHGRHKDRADTPRKEVVDAWQQEGRLGELGSADEKKRVPLFFGPGGTYTSADLRARASMLETLEAAIQLMNEELELFLREITRARVSKSLALAVLYAA
jgi:hypothetical protein